MRVKGLSSEPHVQFEYAVLWGFTSRSRMRDAEALSPGSMLVMLNLPRETVCLCRCRGGRGAARTDSVLPTPRALLSHLVGTEVLCFFVYGFFFFFHLRHDYYCWKPVLSGEDEFLFLRALQRGLSHCVRNRIPRADPRDRLGARPKSLSRCSLETVRPCSFKGFVFAFPACFWSLLVLTVDAHIIQSPKGT